MLIVLDGMFSRWISLGNDYTDRKMVAETR